MPRTAKPGNKLGRPFEYTDDAARPVTLSLRVPRDLYARLERYAYQHRQSYTELLIEGLKMVLDDGTDPYHPSSNGTQHYGNTTMREETPVPLPSSPVPGMDPSPDMVEEVEDLAPVPVVIALGVPDAVPAPLELPPVPGVLPPLSSGSVAAARQNPGADFDTSKFMLGTLCGKGHEHGTTGKSLRRFRPGGTSPGNCVQCHHADRKPKAKTVQVPA